MGAFKLGNMTFGSLFKKPETVKYPVERKPQPEGLKGLIAIDVNNCILCGMCDRSCPTDCITVDKAESYWSIDRFACIQCNYCVTVCPKGCLSMRPDYAPAGATRQALRFDVPKQEKAAKKETPKAEPKQAEAKAEKAPEEPKPADVSADACDEVLEAKLAGMDPEKASKVRAALGL